MILRISQQYLLSPVSYTHLSDILTEFRGRSDEIRVHPLSFAEYYSAVGGDKQDAFDEFAFYGGMPLILSRPTDAAKMAYLKSLFSEVYLKDIVERKKIKREDVLSAILDLLCSSIGSLTNPTKVAATINTVQKRSGENVVALNTVKAYICLLYTSLAQRGYPQTAGQELSCLLLGQ